MIFSRPLRLWLYGFFLIAAQGVAEARERLGTFEIEDITLRPRFQIEEPSNGSFSMGESTAGLRWSLVSEFSSVFRIGSRQLINAPRHYIATIPDEMTLIEGYVHWRGNYGELKMGLIPLQFGVEGETAERDLYFSRSLLFSERVVALRDLGIQYHIDFNGYFTSFAIHNGEGSDDLDGRVFYTSKWGWTDENRFQLGLSAQTGTTKPIATAASGDTLGGVDPAKAALWRMGGLFVEWKPAPWRTVLEAYFGEREQEKEIEKFNAGHLDLLFDVSAAFGVQLRYDRFEASQKVDKDVRQEASLGFRISDRNQTSSLYLIGTKRFEQGNEFANDRVQLIWSATP